MIKEISGWSQGIIVSIIVTTLLELLLPNGSIKKIVSILIGMYLLLMILSPIVQFFYHRDILQMIDIQSYTSQMEKQEKQTEILLENQNTQTIKDIYRNSLEYSIKSYVEQKGYLVKKLYISIKNDENYTIERIEISVDIDQQKRRETTQANHQKIQIDDIVISRQNNQQQEPQQENLKELQNSLAAIYGIDSEIIQID